MSYDRGDPGGSYGQPPPRGYPQQPPGVPGGPPFSYPQHPSPQRRGGCGRLLLISSAGVVGLLVVLAIVGALVGSDPGDSDSSGDRPAGPEVYEIGQVAHTGEFDVTVHALEDPFTEGVEIIAPEAGQRFVAVEATVTNTSGEPLPFSTLAGVELFDQLDRPWPTTITASQRPSLDAMTVAPGEARRGWVMFSVPDDATELRIRIKGNLTANGSVFKLT